MVKFSIYLDGRVFVMEAIIGPSKGLGNKVIYFKRTREQKSKTEWNKGRQFWGLGNIEYQDFDFRGKMPFIFQGIKGTGTQHPPPPPPPPPTHPPTPWEGFDSITQFLLTLASERYRSTVYFDIERKP